MRTANLGRDGKKPYQKQPTLTTPNYNKKIKSVHIKNSLDAEFGARPTTNNFKDGHGYEN